MAQDDILNTWEQVPSERSQVDYSKLDWKPIEQKQAQNVDFSKLNWQPVESQPKNQAPKNQAGEYVSGDYDPIKGAGEALLSLGSGAVLGFPTYLGAGVGGLINRALGSEEDPKKTAEKFASAVTYSPRTKAGKAITGAITYPMDKLTELSEYLGKKTALKTDSPVAGALTEASIQMAPSLISAILKSPAEKALGKEKIKAEEFANVHSLKNENLQKFKDLGFVIPPEKSVFTAISGKNKTDSLASIKNVEKFNELAAKDINLPKNVPLSIENLDAVRGREYQKTLDILGQDYGIVKQSPYGETKTRAKGLLNSENSKNEFRKIFSKYSDLPSKFPETMGGAAQIQKMANEFLRNEYAPKDAIGIIKELRANATADMKNYNNQSLVRRGMLQVELANAMENMIGENLTRTGNPKLLSEWQKSREILAKTFDIEKAVNWATGDISAQKLKSMVDSGRPLSGGLLDIATFAKAYPEAAKDVSRVGAYQRVNPWDSAFAAGSIMAGHPAVALSELAARGYGNEIALGKPYQKYFIKPQTYTPSRTKQALHALTRPAAYPALLPRFEEKDQETLNKINDYFEKTRSGGE